MTDEAQPVRKGGGTSGELHRLDALRLDEMTIIDALRRMEHEHHPGLLVIYFNGSNFMLYDTDTPRYLPRT